jgi:hypothetical protein
MEVIKIYNFSEILRNGLPVETKEAITIATLKRAKTVATTPREQREAIVLGSQAARRISGKGNR